MQASTRFWQKRIVLDGASMVLAVSAGATLETKLTADDAASVDIFGGSVSISGEYAIVGASRNSGVHAPLSGNHFGRLGL